MTQNKSPLDPQSCLRICLREHFKTTHFCHRICQSLRCCIETRCFHHFLHFLYIVLALLVVFSVKMVKKRCWSWCADLRNRTFGGRHRQQPFNPLTFIAIRFDSCLSNVFVTRKSSKDQIKSTNQRKHVFIVNYENIKKHKCLCWQETDLSWGGI